MQLHVTEIKNMAQSEGCRKLLDHYQNPMSLQRDGTLIRKFMKLLTVQRNWI